MPRKFDFISPGILLNEVDESVLPAVTQDEGPLLIGQALTGPSMKPVRVKNLEDLYAIFGKPISGKGAINSDVWRDGNLVGPTYAMFAAQAHLASNTTPITFMRLVGESKADDLTGDAQAGWDLGSNHDTTVAADNDTAYGLFIAPSGSGATGSLCAIFYANGAGLMLSGSDQTGAAVQGSAQLVKLSASAEIKLVASSSAGETSYNFNFNESSENYIRNRFNTNPQKMNASNNFGGTNSTFFLGESFELAFEQVTDGQDDIYATIVALDDGTTNFNKHKEEAKQGETGWFVNRTVSGTKSRLFKFVAHSAGEYISSNWHVEISDLKMGNEINPNSSFTVKFIVNGGAYETFTGCTLNPSDANYIAKKIGDQYQTWNDTERKWNVRGLYPNKSDYFYVVVDSDVENQIIEDSMPIPVGFEGPAVHTAVELSSSTSGSIKTAGDYFKGNDGIFGSNGDASYIVAGLDDAQTIKFEFPTVKMTSNNTNNNDNYFANSVFGLRHVGITANYRDGSYADVTRGGSSAIASTSAFTFSLEDMATGSNGLWYWNEGSENYKDDLGSLFNEKVRQFAAPVIGGFDGVNALQVNPFAGVLVGTSGETSYVRYTLDKALDIAAEPESVEFDLLAMPGQTNTAITNKIIATCENRGDALAIIDLDAIYENPWENNGTARTPSVTEAIQEAQGRTLNSSYAATYYPSIRMVDTVGGNNDVIIMPPSVAAIGAIAKSQAVSEPWFAPAGFNRGGINELGGTQGPRVIGTTEHLSKADRDALYEENINPIARFPASGDIVIFGQKTLQQLPSALDRINVRRLLLYIKRRVGKVSETILFDQNVQATWNRFKAQAEPILSDVQARLGIVEYKLVLDETTTTADLVDRNILYAKVLIKPARAIEFIVVDFVVTRSGIEL